MAPRRPFVAGSATRNGTPANVCRPSASDQVVVRHPPPSSRGTPGAPWPAEVHVRLRREVDRREARLRGGRVGPRVREPDVVAARLREVEDAGEDVGAVGLEAVDEGPAGQLPGEDRRDAAVHVLPGLGVIAEALRERRVDRVPLARRARRERAADPLVGAEDRGRLLVGDPAVQRVGVGERDLLALVHPQVAHDRLVLGDPVAEVGAEPGRRGRAARARPSPAAGSGRASSRRPARSSISAR